jgi:histone H3/H4
MKVKNLENIEIKSISDKEMKKAKRYRKAHKKGLALSPIRDLMGDVGAEMVAKNAVGYLKHHLEDEIVDLTKRALQITEHANRKKVTKGDLQMAIDFIEENEEEAHPAWVA